MKTAIVAGGTHLFGKEIIALELGKGLHERGHEVVYVSSLWCGDGEFGRRLQALGIPARFMRLGFISASLRLDCVRMTLDQLARVPGLWRAYAAFLREEAPDQVIHTNWHHLLVLWPWLNAARDWFWVHDIAPNKRQYRVVFQNLDRKLRGWIAVSQAVSDSLRELGIPPEKIAVIHNGIEDPAKGTELAEPESSPVRIGIVGQVAEWKGHRDLVEAFSRIAAETDGVELHIVGKGPEEFQASLREQASLAGISDRVCWHGFVKDRGQIYRGLHICVAPSRFEEPFGLVALEASFFGLPTVVTRSGGLPEVIEQGVTGLLVEIGNVEQLAASLRRLIFDPQERRSFGAAARERALRLFELQCFVSNFEDLLKKAGPGNA